MTETNRPKIGEPLAVLRHSDAAEEWATSPERTVVFSVDHEVPNPEAEGWHGEGEEPPATIIERIDYTMPKKPNAGLALAYLKQARQNSELAMSWLIETGLGSDGYDALVDELAELEPAEAMELMRSVAHRIQTVAMGGLEAPKA